MRNPNALDAMARWLVLTLAGVGLFALVPGSSFAAPGFASTRWLLALHPVQLAALVMMALAWLLFVVHVGQLGEQWVRDLLSVTLALVSLASVGLVAAAFTWGPVGSVVGAFLASLGVHIALCVRIELIGRRRAPAASVVRPRRRRAATVL